MFDHTRHCSALTCMSGGGGRFPTCTTYGTPFFLSTISITVVQLAASTSKFNGVAAQKAVELCDWGLRFQVPAIVIAAIAPLICLVDDMTTKHVFATVHFVAIAYVLGSFGIMLRFAFGMVITQVEQIVNKTEATIKSLKNMKLLKREAFSQVRKEFTSLPTVYTHTAHRIKCVCPRIPNTPPPRRRARTLCWPSSLVSGHSSRCGPLGT